EGPLDPDTRATEALMMGLRLAEGVDLADIALRTGLDPASMIDRKAITHLAEQGLVALSGNRLAVTLRGMLLLDAILATLL
ncbi:MAG TPA: coproporphyrinogen III oxidase, partial [Sphingobium sp.]|nr:coproporphyrinogen III oxidase [Sphingobium sp.]